jgi:hypothetical protein
VNKHTPPAQIIAEALGGCTKNANGWMARCPCHDDSTASLSISDGRNGVLVYCHAGCSQTQVIDTLKARGLWEYSRAVGNVGKMREVASYPYTDESGAALFEVVRFEPKTFRQRRKDEQGRTVWNVQGVRQVPYRLTELAEAIAAERVIFIVEGEKDVDNLAKLGIPATCNAGGAEKWKPALNAHFAGADVVIIPDKDEPGRKHLQMVGENLLGIAKRVRVLQLPVKDVSDWLEKAGGTSEQLYMLADAAPDWVTDAPETAPETTPARFAPIWLSDIKVEDDPPYLVDGVLPLGPSLGVTFGLPGSLKTFFVMNMLLHVAAGLPLCDREVMQGAVIYITSEGVLGVKRRLIAMREHLGLTGNVPFGLIPAMPNLGTGTADRDVLTKEIEQAIRHLKVPLRAIAIDTVRRAMAGKAENKQEDMSVLVDNCGALTRRFDTHVHAIHHSPRSDDSHGSGSNALDAATDVMIRVCREGKTLKATAMVDRMKDGPDGDSGAAFALELKPRQIGIDRNGNPVMSCSVEITEDKEAAKVATSSSQKKAAAGRPPRNSTVFVDAFSEALDNFGEIIQVRGSGPKVKAVDVRKVREEFKRRHATGEEDPKKRAESANKAFRRILNDMPSKFVTENRDDREMIWRVG